MLGYRLMTVHNLFFYQEVLSRAREAIGEGNFTSWAKEILSGPLGADPGPSGGSEGRPEASGRPLAGGKKKSE